MDLIRLNYIKQKLLLKLIQCFFENDVVRDGFDLFWKVDASLVHKVGQYKNGKGLALCERSTKTVFLRVIDLMIKKSIIVRSSTENVNIIWHKIISFV